MRSMFTIYITKQYIIINDRMKLLFLTSEQLYIIMLRDSIVYLLLISRNRKLSITTRVIYQSRPPFSIARGSLALSTLCHIDACGTLDFAHWTQSTITTFDPHTVQYRMLFTVTVHALSYRCLRMRVFCPLNTVESIRDVNIMLTDP